MSWDLDVVIGCGYVGERLARRLRARGRAVLGTCRSPERAARLAQLGIDVVALDVAGDLCGLGARLGDRAAAVWYLVPPRLRRGAGAETAIDGAERIASLLAGCDVRAAVLASSTAVYGDRAGGWVDADSEARPDDARGYALAAIERCWCEALPQARVVRLAGLYGPGRVIGLAALRAGGPIAGNPSAWLNLLHADDAAALLEAVTTSPATVELGCDGAPVQRHEYYDWLAARLGVRARYAPCTRDARGSRRCDPTPTIARTGWKPRFADFRAGVAEALARDGDP